jgi:uroporphyrinogen decarboxylase
MNDKERFHSIMAFEKPDRMLRWEQGFWGGTVERWYREGMNREYGVQGSPAFGDTLYGPATPIKDDSMVCLDVAAGAGLDKPSLCVPVELFLCPSFEEKVLEDLGDRLIVRDELGIVKQVPRGRDSIPNFVSWPVKSLDDFEDLAAERLDPNTPGRFPPDWKAQVERLNTYDGVVALGGYPCGLFGTPRFLMGEVAFLMAFLDEPAFVHCVIDRLASLWVEMYDRVLSEVRVDFIHIWEDMSYKNGPLISPALFRSFLVPAYQRITEVARRHGVNVVLVDTDGDCTALIPDFIAGGVTGLFPFEVQAGMDVKQIRRRFPTVQILGGIDKREIAAGPTHIEAELARRLPGLVADGGYIPMADHQVPPEVSWDNYRYYRRRCQEITTQELDTRGAEDETFRA